MRVEIWVLIFHGGFQMSQKFPISKLTLALLTLPLASLSHAAGLDRSGQDTTAFFQDGTYAEAVYTYVEADVTGVDNDNNKTGDIAEAYDFFRYGVKTDVNDRFSVGVLYDEPWGAAAKYRGDNNFMGPDNATSGGLVQSIADQGMRNTAQSIEKVKGLLQNENINPTEKAALGIALPTLEDSLEQFKEIKNDPKTEKLQGFVQGGQDKFGQLKPFIDQLIDEGLLSEEAQEILKNTENGLQAAGQGANRANQLDQMNENAPIQSTNVEVRSNTLSLIGGMRFGANNEFQIYGGPVAQRLKADVKLRGDAYKGVTGYNAHLSPDQDYGFLAGVSYSKPEIALKAALTYRSEIDHTISLNESIPATGIEGNSVFEITTPESFNFDFQTGINPTTLATAKVRYVPWSDFKISPTLYTEASKLPLVDYSDDQWQVELGLGKRLADNLAVSGSIGWDSGAGDPASSLGPIEGYYSVGLGAKYDVTKNWAISAGGKYLWFGDAKGSLPDGEIVSNFEDNEGYIVGVKLSYQDK